jgi:hypothetical protein
MARAGGQRANHEDSGDVRQLGGNDARIGGFQHVVVDEQDDDGGNESGRGDDRKPRPVTHALG